MAKIRDTNNEMVSIWIKEAVVGSIDICSLYPSLIQKKSARIIAEELMRNEV